MISVLFAGVSVVFALVYYRTSSVWWQKEEMVRSMTHTYVEELMKGKTVSEKNGGCFGNSCPDLEIIGRNLLFLKDDALREKMAGYTFIRSGDRKKARSLLQKEVMYGLR